MRYTTRGGGCIFHGAARQGADRLGDKSLSVVIRTVAGHDLGSIWRRGGLRFEVAKMPRFVQGIPLPVRPRSGPLDCRRAARLRTGDYRLSVRHNLLGVGHDDDVNAMDGPVWIEES
jgi:hypothetical protein